MSLPQIAIVGRPNVGKSTLFNCLSKTRQALVADHSGLTRDRQYALGKVGDRCYSIIDTGGLIDNAAGVEQLMQEQAHIAISESTLVLLVVDASVGLNAADESIAQQLRKLDKPVILVLNKCDKNQAEVISAEFSRLGYAESVSIAAAHRRGINNLAQVFCQWLPKYQPPETDHERICVAIMGKPNVGKSTLVNLLAQQQRVVATDMPGTTRDSIRIPVHIDGQAYELIDTAGVRRRKSVHETVEKFSVLKALEAINHCHIVLLLVDALAGVSDQDLTLASVATDEGKGIVVLFNKWDCLDKQQRQDFLQEWQRRAFFLYYVKQLKVSALQGSGIRQVVPAINEAYRAAFSQLKTAEVNQILLAAIAHKKPQSSSNQPVKLRYAHLGGSNPPTIVIHGNSCKCLADSYKRFLENTFRQAFNLYGTPIRLIFKTNANPYAGRKRQLTQRQQQRKRRLMKHVKK